MATIRRARAMRREPTDAEQRLWKLLRSKQLAEYKFRRQHPIGPYIADFACFSAKLVIELDGGQHAERIQYDEQRRLVLERAGWRVIRFGNPDVLANAEGVAETVLTALSKQQ
jgi:very-short-patch-repair endonuclease